MYTASEQVTRNIWRAANKAGIIFPDSFQFQSGGAPDGYQKEIQDQSEEKQNLNR